MIERIPFTLGNPVRKSIETDTHGFSGTGIGCNKPASFLHSILSC